MFSSQETSWPGLPVNDCRKEEINTSPPEADWNQERFDFTPSPFSIKEAWILTQARWLFGTQVHHLLSLLAFKLSHYFLSQQLVSQFIGLLCGKQYELGLSNINIEKYITLLFKYIQWFINVSNSINILISIFAYI